MTQQHTLLLLVKFLKFEFEINIFCEFYFYSYPRNCFYPLTNSIKNRKEVFSQFFQLTLTIQLKDI